MIRPLKDCRGGYGLWLGVRIEGAQSKLNHRNFKASKCSVSNGRGLRANHVEADVHYLYHLKVYIGGTLYHI